eukprot:m.58612 g.58612  ORF g.58612 m.58612 type:complete len:730 (+) comp34819_c0_seq19:76-2265(+)
MADLESVLADVSFLLAVDRSRDQPAARVSRKIVLPDARFDEYSLLISLLSNVPDVLLLASIHCVMHKYLTERNETSFEKVFDQKIGSRFYLDFCSKEDFTPPLFHSEILEFERLKVKEDRLAKAKEIFDKYIMSGLLVREHSYSKEALEAVQEGLQHLCDRDDVDNSLFHLYKKEIEDMLYGGHNLFEKFLTSRFYVRFCQWKNLEYSLHISIQDFVMHRIIGRGGFGEVYGCRKADTGMMYAMKCLDKKRLKRRKGEKAAINERNVLSEVNSPFIVCMTYAFQTQEKLCFVLDLMNGGDLHYHLTQVKCFKESDVRFYASEILLGLDHLHSKDIVYRDLKPANCLLTEEGHVKISDLGLACVIKDQGPPTEKVGTHGYMAPEVLQKLEYGCTSDWFSFGCMIFKLLAGRNPFRHGRAKDKVDVDEDTLNTVVSYPSNWSEEIRNLVSGLLVKDPSKRLGSLGSSQIQQHVFFRDVNWEDVYALRCQPPFLPPRGEVNAMDSFQIGQFDDEDVKGIKLEEEDQKRWKDFDLVVSSRWQEEMFSTSVFDVVNSEYERVENRHLIRWKKTNADLSLIYDPSRPLKGDCILEGYLSRRAGGALIASWEKRYFHLYPNRLEWSEDQHLEASNLVTMETVTDVRKIQMKGANCIKLTVKGGRGDCVLRPDTEPELAVWFAELKQTVEKALRLMQNGPKIFQPGNGRPVGPRYSRVMSEPGTGSVTRITGRTTNV